MAEECKHKWVKIYYKKVTDKPWQSWLTIPDKFVCSKCLEIRKLMEPIPVAKTAEDAA